MRPMQFKAVNASKHSYGRLKRYAAAILVSCAFSGPTSAQQSTHSVQSRSLNDIDFPQSGQPAQQSADMVKVAQTNRSAVPAVGSIPDTPHKFDITGIFPGMSVKQVQDILRSKPSLDYKEFTTSLKYETQAGLKKIDGSDFIAIVDAANYTPGHPFSLARDGAESYTAHFTTPIAGSEHLYELVHRVIFPKGKEIHEKNLLDSLREKYGQPAFSSFPDRVALGQSRTGVGALSEQMLGATSTYKMIWNSTSRKVNLVGSNDGACHPPELEQINISIDGMPANRIERPRVEMYKFARSLGTDQAPCGDVLVVEVVPLGGRVASTPETTLIYMYSALLFSPEFTAKGILQTQAMLQAAMAADSNASAMRAKDEGKPSL